MIYRKAAGIPILTSLISKTSAFYTSTNAHRNRITYGSNRLMMMSSYNNDIKKDTTVYIEGTRSAAGQSLKQQVFAMMTDAETQLSKHNMTKHSIVNIQSQILDINDMSEFNSAYEDYMVGVTHLPAQLLWQAASIIPDGGDDDDDTVRCSMSMIATNTKKDLVDTAVASGKSPRKPNGAVLPFSPVVRCGDIAYLSGTLSAGAGGMNEQVIATMDRLGDWLMSVDMSWDNVVDVRTVLADINDLQSFNKAYGHYLANKNVKFCPAQTCFQPSGICGQDAGALCEIAVIASASPKVSMSQDKSVAMIEPKSGIYPFSPVIKSGKYAWLSGQLDTIGSNAVQQTQNLLAKVKKTLDTAGLSIRDIVTITVIIQNITDTDAVYTELIKFLGNDEDLPHISYVYPKSLCLGALVEVSFTCRTDYQRHFK